MGYQKEEKLELEKRLYITEKAYNILRREKRKQKISMAKIICNLIFDKYEHTGSDK